MISPEEGKNSKVVQASKLSTLAVKLAKEAYFGSGVMRHYVVQGTSGLYALPETELADMKEFH